MLGVAIAKTHSTWRQWGAHRSRRRHSHTRSEHPKASPKRQRKRERGKREAKGVRGPSMGVQCPNATVSGTSSGRSSRVASGRNTGHLTHRGGHWPGWPSQRRCPDRTLCWPPGGWHQVGRAGRAGLTLPGAMVRRLICITTHICRHTHSFFLLAYADLR